MSDDLQASLDEINSAELGYGYKPWSPLDDDSCWRAAAVTYSTITEAEWRAIDRLVDSLHDGRCIQADLERERDQARRLACAANEKVGAIAETLGEALREFSNGTTANTSWIISRLERARRIAGGA